MKLKEGMYVRTKDGAIAKAEQIIDNEIHFDIKPIFSDGECLGYRWFYVKDVIKASNNIIDLIEVGDHVNGSKVVYFMIDEEKSIKEGIEEKIGVVVEGNWETTKYLIKDIKTILTKEQFSSMEYKINE